MKRFPADGEVGTSRKSLDSPEQPVFFEVTKVACHHCGMTTISTLLALIQLYYPRAEAGDISIPGLKWHILYHNGVQDISRRRFEGGFQEMVWTQKSEWKVSQNALDIANEQS